MSEKIECCFLEDNDIGNQCPHKAVFQIWNPPDPYQITYSCEDHLVDMMTDGENIVTGLKNE
jgi:hypothetical protein